MTQTHLTELSKSHIEYLKRTFGDAVTFEPEKLRVYASDASLKVGTVLAMVRPTCTEQVQELMRWADEERVYIHPRGRGTSLSGGCVPTRPGNCKPKKLKKS